MRDATNDATDAIAIIFAGGHGIRMQRPGPPKQFVITGDRPVLVHTLQHFQAHGRVRAIYIACLETYLGHARELVRRYRLTKVRRIVPGGFTAQESILRGLESAVADGVDGDTPALIHDGVRPMITADLISRNISCAYAHGNAVTAIPCFETIAVSHDRAKTIASVPERDLMHVLQAPQTFRLREVQAANRKSVDDGLLGRFVDQAQLMAHYGHQLHIVEGLRGNTKLTTEFDLLQFSLLLASGTLDAVGGAQSA